MKNDPLFDRFLDLTQRRTLSPAEQAELNAWLATHPQSQAELSDEIALTEILVRLPDVPVPSNFTARVLNEVKRQQPADLARSPGWQRWLQFRWLPRVGFAAVVVMAGGLVYQREHLSLERREYAESIAKVSEVSSMPSPEILQNFEAIRRINQVPAPDEQLLNLLQ
jgi:anti-sigma factor RsiW